MADPYLRDDGAAVLQDSWFCFLDILGFKEILTANDHSRIQEFHRLLRDGRQISKARPMRPAGSIATFMR